MTIATEQPKIEIVLDINEDGQAEPRMLMSVIPNESMRAMMQTMDNPHYLVTVSAKCQTSHGDETDYCYFEQTSAQVFSAVRGYQYIQLARPESNRISVTVIDIQTRNTRKQVDTSLRYSFIDTSTGVIDTYSRLNGGYRLASCDVSTVETPTYIDVEVDEALFAPEPAQWKKILVSRCFGNKGVDQCGFRKRLILSLIIEMIVQLFGVVVRPICLILVVLFACRSIPWKMIFSIRPTALWTDSGSSFWFTDKEGRERDGWIAICNPVTALALAAIAFLVPAIFFGIFNIRAHKGMSEEVYPIVGWGWWQTFFVINISAVGLGLVAISLYWLVRKLVVHTSRDQDLKLSSVEMQQLQSQSSIPINLRWEAIPTEAKTLSLRFNHLKTKVCKPFAR